MAATESGSAATNSMLRGPGSFVLHDEPDTSEYVEGAYRMALGLLGGYAIEEEAHGDR
ncbi:hypothetical protein [Nocardia arthritidis]|uniref:Uncharacterized protein n=1 Tax=Nocardia arthritidis TaxID=228602 RepID=A0A6G9YT63_9NOCA|nr:hypothetical protein [Nocardia arthritidis]QIS16402.1 hypothetical protein F5544_42970 [Nocardia arthritidis]